MFGGQACLAVAFNDVWSLSLADPPAWSLVSTTGTRPAPRKESAAVYDPIRDRLVIFGGYEISAGVMHNDVWALSLSDPPTWQKLSTAAEAPAPRQAATLIYDPIDDRLVVFGGSDGEIGCVLGDTWTFSFETHTWQQLAVAGEQPGARFTTGVYDSTDHRMLIYGGGTSLIADCGPYQEYTDTWQLSLSGQPTWSLIPTSGSPAAPIQSVSVYDPVNHAMWLFGGWSCCYTTYDDTYLLALAGEPTWLLVPTVGVPTDSSGSIWQFKGVYDPERHRILGMDHTSCSEDQVWSLHLTDTPCNLTDNDGDGLSECDDCDDTNPTCTTDCTDADGDGFCVPVDCDDANANTYPDAPEINDGEDNQCPGDAGYGVSDEVAGFDFGDPTMICWPAQAAATQYEVARSDDPTFAVNCTLTVTASTCVTDPDEPPNGSVFDYLVRSIAPLVGSWGQDSSGAERTNVCP